MDRQINAYLEEEFIVQFTPLVDATEPHVVQHFFQWSAVVADGTKQNQLTSGVRRNEDKR